MHKQSALKQALVEGSGEGWAGSGGWIGRGFSYWLNDSKARIQCRTSESACDGTTARDPPRPPHFSSSSHCQVVCSVHHAARVTATLAPVVQYAGEAVRSSSGRSGGAHSGGGDCRAVADKGRKTRKKENKDPKRPPRPSL